jgi:hypothetical protein
MMKHWLMMLILVCLSLMLGGVAQAAGAPWTVWLYEPATGRMTQVDNIGSLPREVYLPADSGSTFSQQVSVSPDGMLVAYVHSAASGTFLSIHDLNMNTTVFSYALPTGAYHSLDLAGSPWNWRAGGGETFAFGYADGTAGWEIVVVDIITLSTFSLRSSDAAVVSAGLDSGFGFLVPVVQLNRDFEITFTQVAAATGGAPAYQAFIWNTADGSVRPNAPYLQVDTDTLPITGDMVMTLSDPSFPGSIDPTSGFPVSNTLYAFDAVNFELTPVTSIPSIFKARFAQNGERVVVANIVDTGGGGYTDLLVLERSGGLVGSVPGGTNFITSMSGTLNGFLYTANSGGAGGSGGTTLSYVETRLVGPPFTALSSWNSPLGADARIAWVSDINVASVGPFIPWGHITPGASTPTLAAPPTPVISPVVTSPSPAGVLTVGGQATVQTTAGDVLNLRSAPGRSFSRLGTVGNGTIVTLVEGPVGADGLNWWRVLLPTGLEGWVVDFVDGVQTLVPR